MLLATNSLSEFFFFWDELHRNSSPHFDTRNLQETLLETQDGKRQVTSILYPKIVRTLPIVEVPSCQEMVSPQIYMVGQPKNSIWEWEFEELIPYAVDISVFGKRASRQKCVLVPITLRRHCGGMKKS